MALRNNDAIVVYSREGGFRSHLRLRAFSGTTGFHDAHRNL